MFAPPVAMVDPISSAGAGDAGGHMADAAPLETYLRVHFTKVGEQSRKLMATYRKTGKEHGISLSAIPRLVEELDRVQLASHQADEPVSEKK